MAYSYEVPLVTKTWDIEYGTLVSLPLKSFVKTIIKDADGEFTIYCTNTGTLHGPIWRVDVANPAFDFDYTLSTKGNLINFLDLLNRVNICRYQHSRVKQTVNTH